MRESVCVYVCVCVCDLLNKTRANVQRTAEPPFNALLFCFSTGYTLQRHSLPQPPTSTYKQTLYTKQDIQMSVAPPGGGGGAETRVLVLLCLSLSLLTSHPQLLTRDPLHLC